MVRTQKHVFGQRGAWDLAECVSQSSVLNLAEPLLKPHVETLVPQMKK